MTIEIDNNALQPEILSKTVTDYPPYF